MAHVDFAKTFRVGRYGVDVALIEDLTCASLTLDGEVAL